MEHINALNDCKDTLCGTAYLVDKEDGGANVMLEVRSGKTGKTCNTKVGQAIMTMVSSAHVFSTDRSPVMKGFPKSKWRLLIIPRESHTYQFIFNPH